MNKSARYFHLTFWSLAYAVWLVLTMGNHPSWGLRLSATLILVVFSALYACCLSPRIVSLKDLLRGGVALLACGVFAALIIHLLYDVLIGPDPRRFSLATNILMDTGFVFFNTVIAGLVALAIRQVTGRSVWIVCGGLPDRLKKQLVDSR